MVPSCKQAGFLLSAIEEGLQNTYANTRFYTAALRPLHPRTLSLTRQQGETFGRGRDDGAFCGTSTVRREASSYLIICPLPDFVSDKTVVLPCIETLVYTRA